MNKSQLRKLAREYALGNLEEAEYRQRRRTLVDDIVSGKVAIVREVPPPPRQSYSEDPTTKVSIGSPAGVRRYLPVAIFIALVVIAGAVWMLVPGPARDGGPVTGVDQGAQEPISRARLLIEEFIAQKDLSAFSIASFKESWSHLTYAEKREAYSAHWFDDLINLISDEIKARNALVSSDESGAAAETGRRLADFAAFLGISAYVTGFQDLPEQPEAVVAAIEMEPGDAQAPSVNQNAAGPGSTPVELAKPGPGPVHDSEWLGAQRADAYTLQLFAVNRLEQVEKLIAANPEVELKVLVSAGTEPRYRVVHGAFDTEDAARAAYRQLPEDVRQLQPVPIVKSLGSLREDSVKAKRVAGLNPSKYTLQVFATDSVDSARRLQADYPSLKLELLETANPYSRYRVLYGSFDTEETARQAAGGLPPELLRDVGNPLVKAVSELKSQ